MKAKKQKTKQETGQPVSGSWEPIREREALPNVRKGNEIIEYYLQLCKHNIDNRPFNFGPFPNPYNELHYNIYCSRELLIFALFIRDLKLTNKHIFELISQNVGVRYNYYILIEIARTGRALSDEQIRLPNIFVLTAVSYTLGFPSVFSFFSFLETVYSVPYDRMMSGEGVKHGQPWYCLNYEDGTIGQGRNDDEEGPNSDI
jgi:hypothetical protein